MVNYQKVRVTRDNIGIVKEAIYPLDQRESVNIGDVVTTNWYGTGQITVFHQEARAMRWDNKFNNDDPSEVGTWIDASGVMILDDGRMFDINGQEVRA